MRKVLIPLVIGIVIGLLLVITISIQPADASGTYQLGEDYSEKIDNAPTDGLLGVPNSLAYRVEELEKHVHNRERWIGESVDQTVAGDWASDTVSRVYQAISGADDYGQDHTGDETTIDEASVLNTGDSPIISGMVKFDLHRLLIVDVSHNTPYKLRIVYGSGTRADAVTALQYSEVLVQFDATNPQLSAGIPVEIMLPRGTCGTTKIWIEAWNVTDDATIDFLVGLHEYEG